MKSFENKVVLVTGAASGIGRAAALAIPCDLTQAAAVQTAVGSIVARWGHLDCAVNAAGVEGETWEKRTTPYTTTPWTSIQVRCGTA